MLSRIENQAVIPNHAPKAVKQTADSGETFSISLDKGMLQEFVTDLKQLGIDTSKLDIADSQGRQVSADSQFLNTSTTAVSTGFAGRLTPFDPDLAGATSPPATTAPEASGHAFVPQFQQGVEVKDVYGESWNLNPTRFATPETAAWMAQKYGTGEVITQTLYGGQGNPFGATAPVLMIKLHNGELVNAGLLASYYEGAPESKFPGLADKMIRAQLLREYGPGAV